MPKHRRKRRRHQPQQPKGGTIKRYIDPSVITSKHKRVAVEKALAKKDKLLKKVETITVRLVLHDGKVIEHEVEI